MKKLEPKDGKMPRRSVALEKPEYADIARSLEIDQFVVTHDRTTTVGVKRALERIGRIGSERKINGVLHVWRRR